MADFLLDKPLDKQDHSFSLMKEKLETIMQTLQNEKYQFVKTYEKQIQSYQQEIAFKDSVIESLNQKLEQSNQYLQELKRQCSKYQSIINDLKGQIFKMVSVVNNIGNGSNRMELKRVKSDYLESAFSKVDIRKDKVTSPITRKFDINRYFQNVKSKNSIKKQEIRAKNWQQSDDNASNAETIKIKPQHFSSEIFRVLKNNNERFKKTLKWGQMMTKPQPSRFRIKEYKQNEWQTY